MNDPKTLWSLYSLGAQLASIVASLVTASAIANGRFPARDPQSAQAMLDQLIGQLDNLLVLGTHIAVHAEQLSAQSGQVQRLRRKLREDSASLVPLEEVRELVAGLRLQMRRANEEEEAGPDTQRHDLLAEAPDEAR